MSIHEVEAIRKRASKGKRSSPWDTDFAEMAKKTVLRRLCKVLALSPQTQRAVALDDLADAGIDQKLETEVEAVEGAITVEVLEPDAPKAEASQ